MTVIEAIEILKDCNPEATLIDFEYDEIVQIEEDEELNEVRLS